MSHNRRLPRSGSLFVTALLLVPFVTPQSVAHAAPSTSPGIGYASTPTVPGNLSTSPDVPCSGGRVGNGDVTLRAVPHDPDGGLVTARFRYWPVGGPATVRNVTVSSGNTASTTIIRSELTDGVTYRWRVRGKDSDNALSAWSQTCSFTVDQTPPDADVTISSAQYPDYGPSGAVSTVPAGTPGQFTIDAGGDTDVIGFFVGIDDSEPSRHVAANVPGGTATITLTPTRTGIATVHVRTFDGVNSSTTTDTDYSFFATAPAGPHVGRDGDLVYHGGRGPGSFDVSSTEIIGWDAESNPVPVTGWDQYDLVVAPGDWDGDGYPDLITRDTNGAVLVHRGNGYGGWADAPVTISLGSGIWDEFDTVVAPGDVDGDGQLDLLARKPTGELILLSAAATSSPPGGTQIGTGWDTYTGGIFAPGDFDGDGRSDVLGIKANGDLHVHYGSHTAPGYFSNPGGTTIDTGWSVLDKAL